MIAAIGSPPQHLDLQHAARVARFYALGLCHRMIIGRGDIEDCMQDLLLAAVAGWPRFDPARASARTFASLLIRHRAASIARARVAQKRGGRSQPRTLTDGCLAIAAEACCRRVRARGTDLDRHLLRRDVQSVVRRLPAELREVCAVLSEMSARSAALALKVPRGRLRRAVVQVRQRFVGAGMGAW